ncbi:MAG: mechanosensitive ion channel [Gammaproteobacteria bacterium]|nr:mechanosensitive ion channel [Gammaproteobacteria bacterium]
MNDMVNWIHTLVSDFLYWFAPTIDYLPNILGGLGLLMLGWIVARLLSGGAVRLVNLLEHAILQLVKRPLPPGTSLTPTWGRALGSIVFWATILFFLALATQVLELDAFTAWVNRVVFYLPTLFVGALIVLAGFLVSTLARDVVIATAPLEEHQRLLLGRLAQLVILVTAVVIGAEQIGVNTTFLVILASVVLGTFLGGVALAVSLGSKTFVANLISGQSVRTLYRVGQRIRIANYEGRILALTPTAVILETAEGRVTLPAKFFSEQPTVLLMGNDPNG